MNKLGVTKELKDNIVLWIKEYFKYNASPKHKAVVGISGGKDSSVVAALCVEALGKDKVLGVLMPCGEQKDISFARDLVNHLGIESVEINIGDTFNTLFLEIMNGLGYDKLSKNTLINLPARLRMSTLYAVAQTVNGRVANTCNYSETYVGYATRWGDNVGDFSPISKLTVTEVIELGKILGLPDHLIYKVPTDGLCGKTDEENLGFSYAELDNYLYGEDDISTSSMNKIIDLNEKNRFKTMGIPFYSPRNRR